MPSGYFIQIWTGAQGAGKSYLAVRAIQAARRKDPSLPIWANTPLWFKHGGPAGYVEHIDEALELRDCWLFLDEVHTWFGSVGQQAHDRTHVAFWSQIRKKGICLIMTAQDIRSMWTHARRMCTELLVCESWRGLGFFTVSSYAGPDPQPVRGKRQWVMPYIWNPCIAVTYKHDFEVVESRLQKDETPKVQRLGPVRRASVFDLPYVVLNFRHGTNSHSNTGSGSASRAGQHL